MSGDLVALLGLGIVLAGELLAVGIWIGKATATLAHMERRLGRLEAAATTTPTS